MLGAFAYLTLTSARNRLAFQLRRLRSPRYVIALLLALGYFALILLPTLGNGPGPGNLRLGDEVHLLAALGALAIVAYWWLFGRDTGALAFSTAEVQFLFPAPVTRRQLIQLKLLRAQLAILASIVIWTLLLGRGSGTELFWLRPLSLWVLFSTVQLHRLGATLARTSLTAHGAAGVRRSGVAVVVVLLLVGAVAVSLVQGWPARGTPDPLAVLRWLQESAQRPLAVWALVPVHAVLAPLFATTVAEWARAIGPAVAIMLVHFVWVVRSDAAFEEAAVHATAQRAQRQVAGRAGAAPRAGWRFGVGRLPLAPLGEPAVAIFWKNVLAAVRGDRFFRQTAIFGLLALVVAAFAYALPGAISSVVTATISAWGVMLLVLGPIWLRNDLRTDLPRLEVLRTYPIAAGRLVAAEIASCALVLSALELLLLGAIFIVQLRNPDVDLSILDRLALFTAAALALPALNALGASLHNAAALLLPAWIPLGADRKPGIEAMGQLYLTILVTLVALALLLLLPVLAGALIMLTFVGQYGLWSAVPAVLAASAVAAGELALILRWLGRVFDRTEPSVVGASA